MPNDLSITRISAPSPATGAPPARDTLAPAAKAATGRALPNPTLRLDPSLGMVVIEFRDGQGALKNSIPTQQQLDAYRTAERTNGGKGPAPDGGQRPAASPAPDLTTPPPTVATP